MILGTRDRDGIVVTRAYSSVQSLDGNSYKFNTCKGHIYKFNICKSHIVRMILISIFIETHTPTDGCQMSIKDEVT